MPSLNGEAFIRATLQSIIDQDYDNIEIIMVDGGSTDDTLALVESFRDHMSIVVSEQDRGLYDAINKGIGLATGDYIGVLHADDFYSSTNAVSSVVAAFRANDVSAVFADVQFVSRKNEKKLIRNYSSKNFSPGRLRYGWMPAHPSIFFKRRVFMDYGLYRTDFSIAGDYEYIVRVFWKFAISYKYLPITLIKMRAGGISKPGIINTFRINSEVMRACKVNGLRTHWLLMLFKYPQKLAEYFVALRP